MLVLSCRPSTIQLAITMGANVNIQDSPGQTAISKAMNLTRGSCHNEAIRVLVRAGGNIVHGSWSGFSHGGLLGSLVAMGHVSRGVKSLAVCSWLRKNSLQACRKLRSYDMNSLLHMHACQLHNFHGIQILLWYGVQATDVGINIADGSVQDVFSKGISTPWSLKDLCARQVLLSMNDITMDCFSRLPIPCGVKRQLAVTVGIPEDEIRAAIPTAVKGTTFSSYIDAAAE